MHSNTFPRTFISVQIVLALAASACSSTSVDPVVEPPADTGPSTEAPQIGERCTGKCAEGASCTEDPSDPSSSGYTSTCRKLVDDCSVGQCAAGETCGLFDDGTKIRGRCLPQAKEGERCYHAIQRSCVDGFYCGEAGAFDYRCKKSIPAGESCDRDEACVDGYRCTGTCVPREPLHGKCLNTFECQKTLYCDRASKTCEPVKGEGGACRANGVHCSGADCHFLSDACSAGLDCVSSGGTGCFYDTDCGTGRACCAPSGGDGTCSDDHFCLRPLGHCAKP
jgi:hypothetical protein